MAGKTAIICVEPLVRNIVTMRPRPKKGQLYKQGFNPAIFISRVDAWFEKGMGIMGTSENFEGRMTGEIVPTERLAVFQGS